MENKRERAHDIADEGLDKVVEVERHREKAERFIHKTQDTRSAGRFGFHWARGKGFSPSAFAHYMSGGGPSPGAGRAARSR